MARKTNTTDPGTEMEQLGRVLSDDDLRAIDTFADAVAFATERFGAIESAADVLGSGFAVVDKARLVGKRFLAVYWRFYQGRYGDTAAVFCVTASPFAFGEDGKPMHRAIINDGGAGIYQTLSEYSDRKGRNGGLMAEDGLTASNYEVEIDGELTPATTYYISTAALPAVNV